MDELDEGGIVPPPSSRPRPWDDVRHPPADCPVWPVDAPEGSRTRANRVGPLRDRTRSLLTRLAQVKRWRSARHAQENGAWNEHMCTGCVSRSQGIGVFARVFDCVSTLTAQGARVGCAECLYRGVRCDLPRDIGENILAGVTQGWRGAPQRRPLAVAIDADLEVGPRKRSRGMAMRMERQRERLVRATWVTIDPG